MFEEVGGSDNVTATSSTCFDSLLTIFELESEGLLQHNVGRGLLPPLLPTPLIKPCLVKPPSAYKQHRHKATCVPLLLHYSRHLFSFSFCLFLTVVLPLYPPLLSCPLTLFQHLSVSVSIHSPVPAHLYSFSALNEEVSVRPPLSEVQTLTHPRSLSLNTRDAI